MVFYNQSYLFTTKYSLLFIPKVFNYILLPVLSNSFVGGVGNLSSFNGIVHDKGYLIRVRMIHPPSILIGKYWFGSCYSCYSCSLALRISPSFFKPFLLSTHPLPSSPPLKLAYPDSIKSSFALLLFHPFSSA